MIYLELLKTEIETSYLKLSLKETFQQEDGVKKTIDGFEENLTQFEAQVETFVTGNKPHFEIDFLLNKRRIFEYKAWIELFIATVLESQPPLYSSLHLEKRKLAIYDRLDALIKLLAPLEDAVLEMRQGRLSKNLDKEIAQALEKIAKLLKDSQKEAETSEQELQLLRLLQNQEQVFKSLASLFNSQKIIWEMLVIKHGRGFLFSDIESIPFSAIYTQQGDVYIILEVMGHLLGYGNGKLACRAVHLQSGTIYALIRSRIEYPEITDENELKDEIEKNFLLTWRESDTLMQLQGKVGILQIRERMAFGLPHGKEAYLVEDYFVDGTLHKYLKDLFKQEKPPLSFIEKFQIGFQILTGLQALHQEGFIHFDIKTENILIDFHSYPRLHVCIADFNTARPYHDEMNYKGLGHTAVWCPPEYAISHLNKDLASPPSPASPLIFRWDIWGMGCVLYCLYFEEWLPWQKFEEAQVYETISQLKSGWIPVKHHQHPYYPLISKMLEPDPAHRATSDEALAEFMTISHKIAPKK